jgi:NADPH:quinone reductase-like Zn-dependent oxidoreductase
MKKAQNNRQDMSTYPFDKEQLQNLRGRTILITGAASGIGQAAAQIAHGR